MDLSRLISVDPSLTCSGWALFDIDHGKLSGAGKIKCLGPEYSMSHRLSDLQKKVVSVYEQLELGSQDVVICEAPTTMKDPRAALQVEQVRGIFESMARQSGALVPGRVNPRSVHYEVIGLKGSQLSRDVVKSSATRTVQALYASELQGLGLESDFSALEKHQDIVDAILVGAYALSRLTQAALSQMPLDRIFEERTRVRRRSVGND